MKNLLVLTSIFASVWLYQSRYDYDLADPKYSVGECVYWNTTLTIYKIVELDKPFYVLSRYEYSKYSSYQNKESMSFVDKSFIKTECPKEE